MTVTAPPRRRPVALKIALSLLVTGLLLVLLEGVASGLLAWKDAGDEGIREELHCRYDPDLGWSHRPSVRVADLYGPGRSLTTNARGLRALEEYTAQVPEGRYRIVCVGDSFTLGYGVDDRATYEAELEAQEPRIQAVNMGQGGYGVDQAYLWYLRDGTALEADLVLFVFIPPDFDRMLDRRFNGLYSKPLLVARDGQLAVENVPVPNDFAGGGGGRAGRWFPRLALGDLLRRLGRGDRAARRQAEVGAPLAFAEVGELMLADLAARCRERDTPLVLVQLPLRDRLAGRAGEVSAWVRGVSGKLGVPFLDLNPDLDRIPDAERELYYKEDGHFNALGNRLIARLLLEDLRGVLPAFPR